MTDAAHDAADRAVATAGYLHDTAVQEATAALLTLELALLDPALPSSVRPNLEAAQEAVRASVKSMRSAMRRLDPEGLHTLPGSRHPRD